MSGLPHTRVKGGEVNVFRGHAPLVSDEREIACFEIIEGQGLNRRGGQESFHCFLAPVNQSPFRCFFVGGLARFKTLDTDRISVGHPPHLTPLVEPSC
jgi:hypothetical protein